MSTANKLTYLNTTKGKIKDAINLTNANILSEDTFRSYAEKLKLGLVDIINNGTDDLYDSFPKTTQTGTEIVLNDTYEAPMEIGLNGNTHQDSYTGKNLSYFNRISANGITFEGNDIDVLNPTNYLYVDVWNLKNNSSLSGKTYTIYSLVNGTTGEKALEFNIGKTGSSYAYQHRLSANTTYTNNLKVATVTLGADEVFTYASLYVNGSTTANFNIKVMVVEGSYTKQTIGDYEPYCGGIPSPNPDYPQPIEVVTGDNTIEVLGKNLFKNIANTITFHNITMTNNGKQIKFTGTNDSSSFYPSFIFYADGSVATNVWHPTSSNIDLTKGFFTKTGIEYVFSLIKSGSFDKLQCTYFIGKETTMTSSGIFYNTNEYTTQISTSSERINFIGIGFQPSQTLDITLEIQLEKGSTASNYEEYQSQTYEIDLHGKNLLDTTKYNSTANVTILDKNNGVLDLEGVSGYYEGVSQAFNVTPNQNYVLSYNAQLIDTSVASANYVRIREKDDTTMIVDNYNSGNQTISFTPTTDEINIHFRVNGETNRGHSKYSNIQLEKGSTATEYEGFYDYKLCKIGDYQDYIGKSTGKNLYDEDSESTDKVINSSGIEVTNSAFNTSDYILIKGNISYNLSWESASSYFQAFISYYDSNKTFIQRDNITTSNTYTKAFTTLENAKYIRISYSKEVNETPAPRTNIQLEQGSTATSWEPFGKDKWYKHSEIGKVVLDGSENWNLQSVNSYNIANFYTYWGNNYPNYQSIINSQLMNYFTKQTTSIAQTQTEGFLPTYNPAIQKLGAYIRIKSSTASTTNEIKTWLSTHNTIVYYALATPTCEIITNETLINQLEELKKAKSVDDKTFISQINEQLPFILDVSALSKN